MHAGQLKTLDDVLNFYQRSPSHEIEHQQLTATELQRIKAYLHTLNSHVKLPKVNSSSSPRNRKLGKKHAYSAFALPVPA